VPQFLATLAALLALAVALPARQPTPADANLESRKLQDDLTAQRAAAIARERRLADERELQLFDQLDQRDKRLRALSRDLTRTQLDRDTARTELSAVVLERSRLVEEIARRDRAYAAEIAEFRRQITGLTETQNPELRAALQRYADGDRVGAFPII